MNILIVLTNKKPGFHFSEFSHPYEFFTKHGYKVVVASILGGECPITSPHPEDKINASFYENPQKMELVQKTKKLDELDTENFSAMYFAGGHGTMFDFPNNKIIEKIMNVVLKGGGVVGAVCHGPAAFVGVKDLKGKYLVDGKRLNSFTNNEEAVTAYSKEIPFLLESKLVDQGAKFESSGPREAHLSVDGNLVTGQNPESVELVIGAMHALLTLG